jgi:hypothetical protein
MLGAYYSLRLAAGWTDTGDYVHTESLLLELTAPTTFGFSPTRIRFYGFPYDVNHDFGAQATSHSIAADDSQTHQRFSSPQTIATPVIDCSVAGEAASAFGYADGPERGYWFFIVHHDRLVGIRLFGIGGISEQAIQDALGMAGSITWGF